MDEAIAGNSTKTAGKGADFGGFFFQFFPESLTGRYTQPMASYQEFHVPPDSARWYHSELIWDIKCPSQAWPGRLQINDH